MPNTSGLGDSEQTTTDMLDIVASSNRDGHTMLRAIAAQAIEDAKFCPEVVSGSWSVTEAELFYTADQMKEYFEILVDDLDNVTFRDAVIVTLVHSALSDVDWQELAANYLTRVKENA